MGGLNNKHYSSQFGRLGNTRSESPLPGSLLVLTWWKEGETAFWGLCYKSANLIHSLPRAPRSKVITLGIRISFDFGGGHIQTLSIITHHRKNKK